MESILASSSPPSETQDPIQAAVTVAAVTDIGMRRRNNQDSMATNLADGRAAWERSGHLFIVADGMGAHAAGELASRLAVDLIQHHYEKQMQPRPIENLHRAVIEANNEIYRRGQANIEFRNMGTTCSVLAFLPEGAICAHVGDSRIYRLRKTNLEQLTFDHSLVWEMHAASGLDEESLQSSTIPKNVITRSLGPNASVLIDLEGPMPIQVGDKFLVCSDGLSGQLTDIEIGVLMHLLPPTTASLAMLDLANLRGGPDNITLIITEVVGEELATKNDMLLTAARSPSQTPSFPWPFAVVMAICLLTAAILCIAAQFSIAIIVAIIGVTAFLYGFIRYQSSLPSTVRDSQQYGRAPYRKYQCHADSSMVERLSGTIQALREAALENHWTEALAVIDKLLPEGQKAEQNRDFSDQPGRPQEHGLERRERVLLHAERVEVEAASLGIEDADDDLLAADGREGGDAQHDVARLLEGVRPALLRQRGLVADEVGHDLQAADDLRLQVAGQMHQFVEHAAEAHAHGDGAFPGLDVDVRGAGLHRVDDHAVHEPHDVDLLVRGAGLEELDGPGAHDAVDLHG